MIYEIPPKLNGTPEQQVEQLRQYLVRLVMILNEQEQKKE